MQTATRFKTKFVYNWNGKLSKEVGVKAFTTVRLHNPGRFFVGALHDIELKEQELGVAKVQHIKTLPLESIDAFTWWLDTGYDAGTSREIVRKMYKNHPDVGHNPLMDIVLMVYV